MKFRLLSIVPAALVVFAICNKYPNQAPGDFHLSAVWPAHPDSLALFTNYNFSYQTGKDAFDNLYAYTVPAGFIDTSVSVTWNLSAKTGTVYFIKTGQCRIYIAGRTSDNRRFVDSCLVTVRNPFGITGDTAIGVNDMAKLFLAPRSDLASLASSAMVEWKANGVSIEVIKVTDTFSFSNAIINTYSIIASFVDTARGDAAPIDTFPLKIGDYQLKATWPAHPDSLALFTNYTFSYQTGLDPFGNMSAYTVPAGFIDTAASVAWNLSQKTGTVYFIKTGQCRIYMAGKVSGGGTLRDSCLVTVRNPFGITGDTAVDIRDTAKLFLAPRPDPASLAYWTRVEWKINGVSKVTGVTDTFKFSDSIAGTYSIIASFVDTAHRDTARLDTLPLKISNYHLKGTWPAHPDSLALFTKYTFSYQTGLDPFDSMYAYTVPAGFIDSTASVTWNLSQKTGTVYFIKTGQCRFYLAGRTSDNRRFEDSCPVTVRNPFGITGDTLIGINETARFTLVPRPDPVSMAPGTMVKWENDNGLTFTRVLNVSDTFLFNSIQTGTTTGVYPIIASLIDTVHRDTARIDTLTLKIWYRIKTTPFGTGSGTILPVNPCVAPGDSQAFTITPATGSVIAKLFKGGTEVTALTTCKWTNVTAPDSLGVMFYAVPAQSKPIPAKGVTFSMGTDNASLGSYGPAHNVTLSYDYYMDSTEVTQNDYFVLMGVNPSFFIGNVNRPVDSLTWFDAVLYCNARSKRDNLDTVYSYASIIGTRGNGTTALAGLVIDRSKIGYRLPFEDECEYACRAGTTTEYYWGRGYPVTTHDDTLALDSNVVWHHNSPSGTQPVATKKPNTFGLYDIIGNVTEWCNDWYVTYTATPLTDPTGPASGTYRVERGGAWSQIADYCFTSAGRYYLSPPSRGNIYGFRAVLQSK
ncbi:MAG: SUMF1/EgtB/PvdO family nonheme iron enzyme [Chitinispirillaceae bacterium]|jgi:formylglycine-generating enzyme required for sulfatase activity